MSSLITTIACYIILVLIIIPLAMAHYDWMVISVCPMIGWKYHCILLLDGSISVPYDWMEVSV